MRCSRLQLFGLSFFFLVLISCGGIGDNGASDSDVSEAAEASIETWAADQDIAFRNVSIEVVAERETSAELRITLEIQQEQGGPWLEHETELSAVRQGDGWSVSTEDFQFRPTERALATIQEATVEQSSADAVRRSPTEVATKSERLSTAESRTATAIAEIENRRLTSTAQFKSLESQATIHQIFSEWTATAASEIALATRNAPTATAPPTATSLPNTPPGTILSPGESYREDDIRLMLFDPTFSPGCEGIFGFGLLFGNVTNDALVINWSGGSISVTDNLGNQYGDLSAQWVEPTTGCYNTRAADIGWDVMNGPVEAILAVRVAGDEGPLSDEATSLIVRVSRTDGHIKDAAWEIPISR